MSFFITHPRPANVTSDARKLSRARAGPSRHLPSPSPQLPPDATQARHSQRVNKMTTPNRDAQVGQTVPQPPCVEDSRVAVRSEVDSVGRAQISTGDPRST